MRILAINDALTGSPANIALMLNAGFERMGHEVTMFTSHRVEESPEIVRKKRLVSIPISYQESLRHYRCLYSPSVSSKFQNEIRCFRPDLVHAHNIHQYLTYDALRIAKMCGANVFMTMHDVFSFAFHRLNTNRFLDSGGADTRLTPFDHIHSAGLQYNPLRNIWIRSIFRRHVKGIVAVSYALERALKQHKFKHTHTIHNGIDLSSWIEDGSNVHAFKTAHNLHNRKVVLFGGRISPDKGTTHLLHTLIKLRHKIPNVLLLVIGDRKRWDECVRTAGIHEDLRNAVHCTGWLSGDDLQAAYYAADIVTVPSLCLDSFPQTNLEAMAARKPVIGTIFGGTSEAVIDQVTGFVLDPRDTDIFAEKVTLLLHNENLAKQMGEAGRKRVEEEFSLEKQVKKYLELFEK